MPLSNSLYNEIMRTYEKKQLDNQYRLQKRYEEIYRELPQIKDLENQISSLSLQKAKAYLDGDEDALNTLHKNLHLISMKKKEILSNAGYPDDYLSLQYTCKYCQDRGYIHNKKCHCFKQAEIELLYANSNLRDVLEQENFDSLRWDLHSDSEVDKVTNRSPKESFKIAVDNCQDFVTHFPQDFRNLFIFGDTGTGKTFLTHCIAKELIDRSFSVVYVTASDLFDILAKKMFEKKEDEHHIYDCDLLIIDDLGTELSNSFTNSQLFVCINERLLNKKPTIISTNLSLEEIKHNYSERVFSRVSSNYTLLRLTGEDIRIKKKLLK